jgi:ABC-2 type transport system permease protein
MSALTELRSAASDSWVMTWRSLMQTIRIPEVLVFSSIQPVMFVLLFAYVFGGAIPVGDGGPEVYRSYLMGGIFVQTVAFTAAATGVGLAEDLKRGLIDRFRSLPISSSAVLVGRATGDTLRNVLTIVIMTLVGLLVGWRIEDGLLRGLAAYLLLLAFAYAMAWIGILIGLSVPSPEVANTAGFLWLFPLTFLSNAFVPLAGMPDWLRPVAEWNPISAVVAAIRELFGNPNPFLSDAWPLQHPVLASWLYIVAILGAFSTLSVRTYLRSTSR